MELISFPWKQFIMAMVTVMVLDALFLGVLMGAYYKEQLKPAVRLAADGAMAPNWYAAIIVYVLLALGTVLFVLPQASSFGSALAYGAAFGLVVYGVYDLTNFAVLSIYPLRLALIDMAWGTIVGVAMAAAVWFGKGL